MFKDNKYTKWYNELINSRIQFHSTRINDYYEKHHIIPKSMGGSNQKSNIIKLTAREHFICHLLLSKMTDYNGMAIALMRMIGGANKHSNRYLPRASKIYEYAKRKASESKRGSNNPMYGRSIKKSDETKLKMSLSQKNSEALKQSRQSVEYKQKISDYWSEEICLISIHDNTIIETYKNCTEAAEHLGCSRGNIKTARRNKRPIGKKLKSIEGEAYVVYTKDVHVFLKELI